MPEDWMNDAVGPEARPRPGFEDALTGELQRNWRTNRRPWRTMAWAAAAVLLVAGVVVVSTQSGNDKLQPSAPTAAPLITPDSSTTSTTVPATEAPTSPPPTTVFDPSAEYPNIVVDESTPVFDRTLLWSTTEPGGSSGWSASVTRSGRVYVAKWDNPATAAVYEVVGTDLVETGLTVSGRLLSGPDERLYVGDAQVLTAYERGAGSEWTPTVIPCEGEGMPHVAPTAVTCGSNSIPVAPPADIATVSMAVTPSGSDSLIVSIDAAVTGAPLARWNPQFELHNASFGDCMDDACLTSYPFGRTGLVWHPDIVSSDLHSLLVALRPHTDPLVGWADCGNARCYIFGVAGAFAYGMATAPDGSTSIYEFHITDAAP